VNEPEESKNIIAVFTDAPKASEWASTAQADYPKDADLACDIPAPAGISFDTTTSRDKPVYYAWKMLEPSPSGDNLVAPPSPTHYKNIPETEYDAEYQVDANAVAETSMDSSPRVMRESLDGIFSQEDVKLETEYDASFQAESSEEPVVEENVSVDVVEEEAAPIVASESQEALVVPEKSEEVVEVVDKQGSLTGIFPEKVYNPVSEYDSKFLEATESAYNNGLEHAHKSTVKTLSGVFDQTSIRPVTEYDSKYLAASEGAYNDGLEHAHKSAVKTLSGVMTYANIDSNFVTEYDAKFKPVENKSTVGSDLVVEDAVDTAEAARDTVDTPMTVDSLENSPVKSVVDTPVVESNTEDVAVNTDEMKFESVEAPKSTAEAGTATDAPITNEAATATDSPVTNEVATITEAAPATTEAATTMEEVAPASSEIVESKEDVAVVTEQTEAPVVAPTTTTTTTEARAPVPVKEVVPAAPVETKKKGSVFFTTTNQSDYAWPAGSGKPPAKAAPASSDLIAGTVQKAPVSPALKEGIAAPLADNKKKMASEYDAAFAWPNKTMNKRGFKGAVPDSLWVLGTKGEKNVYKPKAKEVKETGTGKENERDHLVGTGCVPEKTEFAMPQPSDRRAKWLEAKKRIEPTKGMASAGYVPGPDKVILVSKDQPVEGQIPKLREPRDLVAEFNSMSQPRPATTMGHVPSVPTGSDTMFGRVVPAPLVLDPIRIHNRYPQLSEKQANRWATTSGSTFKWPSKTYCR
jgi:hypothetical protein